MVKAIVNAISKVKSPKPIIKSADEAISLIKDSKVIVDEVNAGNRKPLKPVDLGYQEPVGIIEEPAPSLINKGTTLHLLVHSSSRDPIWQGSPTFNISAKRKKHFGFGGGSHHCVGHFMAKSDSVIALLALSSFMKKIQHDGEATLLPDSGNTSPITLPIKYAVNY